MLFHCTGNKAVLLDEFRCRNTTRTRLHDTDLCSHLWRLRVSSMGSWLFSSAQSCTHRSTSCLRIANACPHVFASSLDSFSRGRYSSPAPSALLNPRLSDASKSDDFRRALRGKDSTLNSRHMDTYDPANRMDSAGRIRPSFVMSWQRRHIICVYIVEQVLGGPHSPTHTHIRIKGGKKKTGGKKRKWTGFVLRYLGWLRERAYFLHRAMWATQRCLASPGREGYHRSWPTVDGLNSVKGART